MLTFVRLSARWKCDAYVFAARIEKKIKTDGQRFNEIARHTILHD